MRDIPKMLLFFLEVNDDLPAVQCVGGVEVDMVSNCFEKLLMGLCRGAEMGRKLLGK